MAARRTDDRGAAVAEFVMISVLLVLLLFAVLQVAVFFYARNVVAASAADAARYSAVSNDATLGGPRAAQLIAAGLDGADARAIRCTGATTRDTGSGLPETTVHCHGQVRAFLVPLDIPLTIDVTSAALTEGGR